MRKIARIAVFNCLLFVACFELLGFALSHTRLSVLVYSNKQRVLERIEESGTQYRDFLAARYDRDIGWATPRSSLRHTKDCRDVAVTYTYDPRGARLTPGSGSEAEILVIGDSFTHGDDVSDVDTYPSQLSRILRRSVVNYGVPGFGPLQATIRFKNVIQQHKAAKVAILGVMSENAYRMMNSYRPVYQSRTGILFGFKPYMKDGQVHQNLNSAPASTVEEILPLVHHAFETDYFRLPEPNFPYSLALLRGLLSNKIRMLIVDGEDRFGGLVHEPLRKNLLRVVTTFAKAAEENQVEPIVLLIPEKSGTAAFLAPLAEGLERDLDGRVTVAPVSGGDFDWQQYREPGLTCHPTAYGYGIIAHHAANAVRRVERRGPIRNPS